MAIKLKFDGANQPEQPTFVLAKRNGEKLGMIEAKNIVSKNNMANGSEITFKVYKELDGKRSNLWEEIKDFRLVWCKEYNEWYEITIELSESNETVKSVSGVNLARAELSQIKLFNIETTVERDLLLVGDSGEVKYTTFYNPQDIAHSLIHRVLDKAPHYKIKHVDSSLLRVNEFDTSLEFSFNDTDIVSAFNEIAERVGCLFVYNTSGDGGTIDRSISVYDLQRKCNACGRRNEHYDECPYCGSTDLTEPYGEDTNIFITSDELTDEITFSSDTNSMKNCFKLEAGDDIINAAIRTANPSGSDYIWYINEETRKDMSEELQRKLQEYDEAIDYYNKQKGYSFNNNAEYNTLVRKYNAYRKHYDEQGGFYTDETFREVNSIEIGYPTIAELSWETLDFANFLETELMPTIEVNQTTAREEAKKIHNGLKSNEYANPSISLESIGSFSRCDKNAVSRVANAIVSMAKAIADTKYDIRVIPNSNGWLGSMTHLDEFWWWSGQIEVKNPSSPEDIYVITYTHETSNHTGGIEVNADYTKFVKSKINKMLTKSYNNDYSIVGIFNKLSESQFKQEMKRYGVKSLKVFLDAAQAALDVLIEQNCAEQTDSFGMSNSNYSNLYVPYTKKRDLVQNAIEERESELDIINSMQDKIQQWIEESNAYLDMQEFLKTDEEKRQGVEYGQLGIELLHFRREDKFSNENFKSDALSVSQQFERAKDFIEYAKREIYKSSELQHSISSTLKNLLIIDKFKPLVNHFELGNWLRVQVDKNSDNQMPYKLRLIDYEVDYDNFDQINVEFSDVVKSSCGMGGQKSIMDELSSISSSYSAVSKNARDGQKVHTQVNDWFSQGLNTTLMRIVNDANGQQQTWDEHGMLFQYYDDITDTYGDEQLKILNSSLVITDDNWKSVKTAVGKMYYVDPSDNNKTKMGYGINAEMLIGRMLIGQTMKLYAQNGGLTFDENGLMVTSRTGSSDNYVDIVLNPNNSDGNIFSAYKTEGLDVKPIFQISKDGELTMTGKVTATALLLQPGASLIMGEKPDPTIQSPGFSVDSQGTLKASKAILYNADVTGTINAVNGYIGGLTIEGGVLYGVWLKTWNSCLYSGINTQSTGDAVFYAGADDIYGGNANFRADYQGNIYSKGNIYSDGLLYCEDIRAKDTYQIFCDDSSKPIRVIDYTNYNTLDKIVRIGNVTSGVRMDYYLNEDGHRIIMAKADEFVANIGKLDVSSCGVSLYGSAIKAGDNVPIVYMSGGTHLYFGPESGVWNEGKGTLTALRGKTVRIYATGGGGVYLGASGTTAVTSDEKVKNISEMDDRYIDFFNRIEPIAYKYKTGHRTHLGFGARAVEQALLDSDLTTEEFAGVLVDKNVNLGEDEILVPEGEEVPDELYSLRYEEFIALNTKVLQQALKRIDALEEEVKSLKQQLESR